MLNPLIQLEELMNIINSLRTGICLAVFAISALAFAQDRGGTSSSTFERPRPASRFLPTVGVSLGVADTDGDYGAGMNYGIEAGIQPYIPFRLALGFSGYSGDGSGGAPSLTRTELLAKATYGLSGNIPLIRHSYFGAEAGSVWDNVDNNVETNFAYGPLLGFDIPLSDMDSKFSLGADAGYLFIGGSKSDALALNAIAKYWF
jgi:hypothetical protein